MEKLIGRKKAAEILGISLASLDAARTSGKISYIQYVPNSSVYFTTTSLQEYLHNWADFRPPTVSISQEIPSLGSLLSQFQYQLCAVLQTVQKCFAFVCTA